MSFGERKEARMLYDAMCDGSDDPLTESELESLQYVFEKESMHNMEFIENTIEQLKGYVPKPIAEARAIGQLVAGSMQMSEIAPRLYATVIKMQNKKYANEASIVASLVIARIAKDVIEEFNKVDLSSYETLNTKLNLLKDHTSNISSITQRIFEKSELLDDFFKSQ